MALIRAFHVRSGFIHGSLSFLILMAGGCSKKGTESDTNTPPVDGPIGVLLSGNDSDSALSGTRDYGPFAVPEGEMSGDFVTTRLEALLHPGVTVGAVNAALQAVDARISCMRAGTMFTELVVPALASKDQAAVACSSLVASGAFLSAYPCVRPTQVDDASIFPSFPANGIATHLEQAKFPAAWNTRERVATVNAPVTVLVADHFGAFTPHTEIPAQTFPTQTGVPAEGTDANGVAGGNHGFKVAGTIGARFDSVGTTGAFADPGGQLRLPSVTVTGIGSWVAILAELSDRLPATGHFVLNTSFGYGSDFTVFSKRQRIEHAFFWRSLVAGHQDRFLHTQSAGNEGVASSNLPNADYNAPFVLAARFNSPFEMLQGTPVSAKDTADLTLLFENAASTNPLFAARLRNVLVVGSSDLDGNLSTFSNLPSDVRMIGETVTLPCLFDDSECGPGTGVDLQTIVNGTSFASPQVAALAAWMWSLSPALTVEQSMATLRNCYDGRWIDAYKAVLSLDFSLSAAAVRRALLDIADANGQTGSNGAFDERDIRLFRDSLKAYEEERLATQPPHGRDHSRFDLNGDGFTGDTSGISSNAPFDLDVNSPPSYSSVSPPNCSDTSFSESALTDRDILYYYAHSNLYTGDEAVRDSLLPCGAKVVALGAEYLAFVDVFSATVLSFDPLVLDSATDGDRFDGATSGSESIGTNLQATVQCGQTTIEATAGMQLTYFTTSGDAITGMSGGVECTESDVNIDDTLCFEMSRTAVSRYFAGFEVREKPVAFSISASTSSTGGRADVSLQGAGQEIFFLPQNSSGGLTGELPPGAYTVGVRGSGNGSVTFSLTLMPIAE